MISDVDTEILGNSLCRTCVYRMSRIVIPFNFDCYDFSEEEIEQIEAMAENGEETLIEEHTCLLLKDMLDCRVGACTFYKNINKKNISSIIGNDNVFNH